MMGVANLDNDTNLSALKNFIIANDDLEKLEQLVNEFNIFTSLKVEHQEIRHSNFLSWLMNPNETHQLGDSFLQLFFQKVISNLNPVNPGLSIFDIEGMSFDDVDIRREWRNIDLLIVSPENSFLCVVENKIHSGESKNQLSKYKSIAQEMFPSLKNKFYVFLTIDGNLPSDSDYIPVSHLSIVEIIERLVRLKESQLNSDIVLFLNHYCSMVRRYIVMDSEIQQVCQKIYNNHKKALDLIFEHRPDKQLEIKGILLDLLEEGELIIDKSIKTYIRFTSKKIDQLIPLKGNGWTDTNRIVLFEFQNRGKVLELFFIIGSGENTLREKLYNMAVLNNKVFNLAKGKLTKKFTSIWKSSVLRKNDIETLEGDELKEKINAFIERFQKKDLPQIEEVIAGEFEEKSESVEE